MLAPTVPGPVGDAEGDRERPTDGARPPTRTLRLGGRRYPVLLPRLGDARLHTAATLLSVQVLGQVALDFELSIAQILASILTCAVMEVVVTFRRQRVLAWPASAMLTGNGIALLMRVEGTVPGDWWSTRGLWIFVAVAAGSMLAKYLIRTEDGHLFNPSNVGLVAAFLVLGTTRINPQDFWWGSFDVGLALTYAVILGGGIAITRRLGLLALGAAYWGTFAAGVGVVALSGHAMRARWSLAPVEGARLWWTIVASPEILIFLFFMITDPRTVPRGRVARVVFGAVVGVASALLLAPQGTEFASKVGVMAGLTGVALVRPLAERRLPAPGSPEDRLGPWLAHVLGGPSRRAAPRLAAAALAVGLLGAGLVAGARSEQGGAAAAADLGARPDVAVSEADLPPIEIDPAVGGVDAGIGPDEARAIAVDLLVALELERRAREAGDAELAALAAVGPRLARLEAQIAADGPMLDPPRTEVTALRLTLLRADPQAIPTFGFEAEGTTTGQGAAPQVFRGSYSLQLVGDHYLIASVSP